MATYNRSHLTDQQAILERVMRAVVEQVQDTEFVLKGGGALVFLYGSHRHTTDLDFDAERKTDMTRRIRRATQASGVEIDENTWWLPERAKRASVSIRYKVGFVDHRHETQELQVDTRYRPRPVPGDIVIVDGIRTYRPDALYAQKLTARRNRNEARDLFDLAFLTKEFGDELSDKHIRKADAITIDIDRLEQDLTKLLRRDTVLARITTAEQTVLEFREAVEKQMRQRELTIPEQNVPITLPMSDEIAALRRLIHGEKAVNTGMSSSPAHPIRNQFDPSESGQSIQRPDRLGR